MYLKLGEDLGTLFTEQLTHRNTCRVVRSGEQGGGGGGIKSSSKAFSFQLTPTHLAVNIAIVAIPVVALVTGDAHEDSTPGDDDQHHQRDEEEGKAEVRACQCCPSKRCI